MSLDRAASAASTLDAPARSRQAQEFLRTSVAGHRILGELGRGGMGLVFLAHEPGLERPVALKLVDPDLAGPPSPGDSSAYLFRFTEEARITGRLQHPGIVPVYRMGSDEDGRCFYTMRPVTEGRTLKQILRELADGGPAAAERWSVRRLVEILRSVCLTVAYAHHCGVIHRDLKPANIVVGDYGEVLVIDWGLARPCNAPSTAEADTLSASAAGVPSSDRIGVVSKRGDFQLTLDGEIVGTPAYMSPEQSRGDLGAVSTASDVYALGAILYEMLALSPPFIADNLADLLAAVASGDIQPPSERSPWRDIPEDLAAVALKAMANAPSDRFASARLMADTLGNWLDGVSRWRIAERIDLSSPAAASCFISLGSSRRRFAVRDGVVCLNSGEITLIYDRRFSGWMRMSCTAWCEGRRATELSLVLCAASPDRIRHAGEDGYCLQFGGKDLTCLNFARHQQDVLHIPDVCPRPGRKYSLMAQVLDGEVSFHVNGEEIACWRDPSPLFGGYVGFYGFGSGARFSDVVVQTLGKPTLVSVLETPDAYFSDGLFSRALDMYSEISRSHPRRIEGLRAAYKAALCMMMLDDVSGAVAAFRRMQQKPASVPLGVLGHVQLLERVHDEAAACDFLLSWARGVENPSPAWAEVAVFAFDRARAHVSRPDESSSSPFFDTWFESALRLVRDRDELAVRASPRYFNRLLSRWIRHRVVAFDPSRAESTGGAPSIAELKALFFWPSFDVRPGMFLESADAFLRLGRPDAARLIFNAVFSWYPDRADLRFSALSGIGRSFVGTLHLDTGISFFEKAAEVDSAPPGNVLTALDYCAAACSCAGRYDKALSCYRRIVAKRPWARAASRKALLSIGDVLMADGDYSAAFEWFVSVPELARHHKTASAAAHSGAGLALIMMGRLDDARDWFERRLFDRSSRGVTETGCVRAAGLLRSIGRHAEALEYLDAVRSAKSARGELRTLLLAETAETLSRMGRHEDAASALEDCRHGAASVRISFSLHIASAHLLRRSGRLAEALDGYASLASSAHVSAAREAAAWVGLIELKNDPACLPVLSDRFLGVALAELDDLENNAWAANWWALAMMGFPGGAAMDFPAEAFHGRAVSGWVSGGEGSWAADESGVPITPAEALRRTPLLHRDRFREMLRFRASFDPAWTKFASP
ncbi:MAG: protein kinase [Planctomycetes bacterium]|nr:protein kinase [Planctomycetota bacterium]